jgi:integrase
MNGELTVRRVEALTSPGRHRVAPNLFLSIKPPARKSWLNLFTCPLTGREHEMGLGAFALVPVTAAKAIALRHRMLVHAQRCPLCERQSTAKPAPRVTFAEVTRLYIAAHRAGWRNPRHQQEWEKLVVHAAPLWARPVEAIDTAAVLAVLEPGWSGKAVTLARVRGRIESVLDFAAARGWRSGENPARWRGHLDQLLPRPKQLKPVQHLAFIAWQDAPAFWRALAGRGDPPALLALQLIALTAVRRSEALGATWCELDREAALWTIPAGRTKANREHRVPLSPPALQVIDALAALRRNDLLLPGVRHGRPVAATEVLSLMQELRPGTTVHGLRATFRTWCAESAGVRQDIAEAALGHAIADQVVASYQRGDLLALRAELMTRWAEYLTTGAGS